MIHKNETESWTLNIGVNSGYDPANTESLSEEEFAALYLRCAGNIYRETGVYISASVQRTRMLYSADWGCPETGEPCFVLRGTRNPLFSEKAAYEAALLKLVELLKAELRQNAVYLEMQPCKLWYFTNELET